MSTTKEVRQPDPYTYFPKQALVVFATNPAQLSESSSSKYYIEISDIMEDRGRAYIGAGKPVTKETLQTMMDVIAESDKLTFHSVADIVPTNLLVLDQRAGRHMIAWWRPAQRQTLMMHGKQALTLWVPALVFVMKNERLAVAAMNKNRRPTVLTRLHHAPFYNVYNDMKVCLGSVKPPKTSGDIRELIDGWENAFWKSEFTESVTGAYKPRELSRWWRKKRRGKFPLKKLKVSSKNLKALCENL